jgi:hypothetical protein
MGAYPPSPREERERLEGELVKRLRAAEKVYRAARAECAQVRERYRGMLDHPDGAQALNIAAHNEEVALEEYSRALKSFTNLVVYGRLPRDPAD